MTSDTRSVAGFYVGLAARLVVLIAAIYGAMQLAEMVKHALSFDIMPHTEAMMHRMLMLGLLGYILLTALPFVPGAEIGMTLLTVFGASVAPLVYAATVLSLMLAYGAGRLVPLQRSARTARKLRLRRVADLLDRLEQTAPEDRPDFLVSAARKPALQRLARYRYVALLVLINMPGNVVIGGGGGLAFAAGLSGVFTPLRFLATVMLAVLPVPLAIFLLGQ